MNKALQVLFDRGFVKDCTDLDQLSDLMDQGPVTFYLGVDPSGASMHIGHTVPVYAMRHLQEYGHNPIALVGGGTGLIGDPSGKTEMRKLLTLEQVQANAEGLQGTLRSQGYDAQVAYNSANQMYRVVAATFDAKQDAVRSRNELRSQYPDAWLLYNQK